MNILLFSTNAWVVQSGLRIIHNQAYMTNSAKLACVRPSPVECTRHRSRLVMVSSTLSNMPEDSLAAHRDRLEAWAKDLLDPYLCRLRRHQPIYETAKEFNDPVWGTLQLRPHEVVILDSPLLQRLRRIRQLGVVHFVYPAATHTRLEHSLGVVHQVQQLVTSINSHSICSSEGRGGPALSEAQERILRLAALCHDVGHGAMSHVSEYSIEDHRECEDIRLAFQKIHEQSAPNQLSEIAAYYIIGSPAFEELLREAQRLCVPPSHIDNLVEKMRAIIIGKSTDTSVLLLHELISGPFDADKLDYLSRDSLMCGVPNVADVPRLVRKVRAVWIDRTRLPKKLKKLAPDRPDGYLVTGVARSGARTLDEVALARTLMFDKIYRHQKVRAAEAMVYSLLTQLATIYPEHSSMLPFAITDDELLGLTRESIGNLIGKPVQALSESGRKTALVVEYLARRLRERRLFVRGFAFSAAMPRDGYQHDPKHRKGLERLISECSKPEGRAQLVGRLCQRLRQLCPLLDRSDLLNVPGDDLTPFIWISPPKAPPRVSNCDTGNAYLIDDDGSLLQAEEDAGDTSRWTNYVTTRDLGYIFTLKRLAVPLYIAAESLVREEYGVRIPDTMLAYAKQGRAMLDKHKRKLEDAGWYDGKPLDLRPMPQVLTRSDAVDRADEIVEKLAGYSGPWQIPKPGQKAPMSTVSREKVLSFVRQFVDPSLVDTALTVLSHIRVIGRVDANLALQSFLAKYGEYSPGSYCALGEFRDSSALLTYYVGDVAGNHQLVQRSLAEALAHEEPIIFVDDLVGRGSQSISIVESWLGIEPTERLNERRTQVLNRTQMEAFRNHRLAFTFIAGLDEGRDRLERRIRELGLNAIVYIHVPESKLPFLDNVLSDNDNLAEFRRFCENKGRALLYSPADGHDDRWVSGRVLGYGNTGLLLASTYNTPTATLTCLWKEGCSDTDWSPLLCRRKKI